VDDAPLVGRLEGHRHLTRDVDNLLIGQRGARHVQLQIDAVDPLHRNEPASFVVVDLVDSADVRVIEARDVVRFALQAAGGLRVSHELL
jgi:hypothetical protein